MNFKQTEVQLKDVDEKKQEQNNGRVELVSATVYCVRTYRDLNIFEGIGDQLC